MWELVPDILIWEHANIWAKTLIISMELLFWVIFYIQVESEKSYHVWNNGLILHNSGNPSDSLKFLWSQNL